jgi:hypothetical protein
MCDFVRKNLISTNPQRHEILSLITMPWPKIGSLRYRSKLNATPNYVRTHITREFTWLAVS